MGQFLLYKSPKHNIRQTKIKTYRQLADQQVGRLLVTTNFAPGDGTGSVAMGLLDTASGRSRLAGRLGGELLSGGFAACKIIIKKKGVV